MSKTVDELVKVFNRAKWDQLRAGDYEDLDRAGVVAIVRALRDQTYSSDDWKQLNEILGDTAEARSAGVLAVESREGAMISEAPEAPATAPAPAVCDVKELVKRLRAFFTGTRIIEVGDVHAAADALEAMAGEVARETKAAGYWMERSCAAENERDRLAGEVAGLKRSLIIMSDKRCDAVAERDRLKAAGFKILAKLDHPTASVTQWDADELRKALGGDAS